MRYWIVVFRAGRSLGRSWSVFTVQRSTPHAARLLAWPLGAARAVKTATDTVAASRARPPRCTVEN
jgi:hypothetical protein